jgi:hypothetical protein
VASTSWDPQGEAQDALRTIVSDPQYGPAALSSAQTMSNLLKDLLPDAPREASVLVAAAEAGLAENLQTYKSQGMDAATATRLVAGSFENRTALTPEACTWAAEAFATSLGMSTEPTSGPIPAGGGEWSGTPQGGGGRPGEGQETMTAGAAGAGAGAGAAGAGAARAGVVGAGPGPAPGTGPDFIPARPPGRSGITKWWAAAGGAAAVIIVVVLVVLLNHGPTPTKPITKHSTPPPSPAVTQVTALSQLLPSDTETSSCKAAQPLDAPGVVSDDFCDTTSPDGIGFDAYQFATPADYAAGFKAINTELGWNPSGAGSSCPPLGSSAATGWHSPTYPERKGQILECFTGKTEGPLYVWTLPTQRAVFIAGGYSSSAAFNDVQSWWHNYG